MQITENGTEHFISCAMPILAEGDIIGCIACVSTDLGGTDIHSTEAKLIQTASTFLGRQFES